MDWRELPRDDCSPELREVLEESYGVDVAELDRIEAGTNTVNYRVADGDGRRWFAKVYRGGLEHERAAIGLTAYAGRAGVPVPEVRRTVDGAVIAERLPMSLWEFVDGETAEGGITGERWPAVGTVLGRLHRGLAEHPADHFVSRALRAGPPLRRPGHGRAACRSDGVLARSAW